MRNPSSDELDDYFLETLYPQANKFKQEKDQKAGAALIFHFLGHGVTLEGITHMILNEKEVVNMNPFPIESRLRAFTTPRNSFVLGSLNCCRGTFKSELGSAQDKTNQILLKFAA